MSDYCEFCDDYYGEYRSPGYWLDPEDRKELGMCVKCGEYLKDCACETENCKK